MGWDFFTNSPSQKKIYARHFAFQLMTHTHIKQMILLTWFMTNYLKMIVHIFSEKCTCIILGIGPNFTWSLIYNYTTNVCQYHNYTEVQCDYDIDTHVVEYYAFWVMANIPKRKFLVFPPPKKYHARGYNYTSYIKPRDFLYIYHIISPRGSAFFLNIWVLTPLGHTPGQPTQ